MIKCVAVVRPLFDSKKVLTKYGTGLELLLFFFFSLRKQFNGDNRDTARWRDALMTRELAHDCQCTKNGLARRRWWIYDDVSTVN